MKTARFQMAYGDENGLLRSLVILSKNHITYRNEYRFEEFKTGWKQEKTSTMEQANKYTVKTIES